jgi:galactokinase
MTASGESSINNYECGCAPLIDLYRILVRCDGVYGARFSGAGFRGCCVGLVDRAQAAQVAEAVRRAYADRQPDLATNAFVAICEPDDGARFLEAPGAPRTPPAPPRSSANLS